MSKTMAIGVVGPEHWAYMAKVMAEKLEEAVQKFCLAKTDIPKGVLRDAAEFSKLVLEGTNPFASPNPPASINAYVMAKKVVEKMIGHYPGQKEIVQLLLGCRVIVGLTRFIWWPISKFNRPEIFEALTFMAEFFSELSKMGEEERGDRGLTNGDDD